MKFRRFGIAAICCTLLLLTACQGKTGGRTSSLVSKNSTSYAVSEKASSQPSSGLPRRKGPPSSVPLHRQGRLQLPQ